MILNFQEIKLLEKIIFRRLQFTPPLKGSELMNSEACLMYALNGKNIVYGSNGTAFVDGGESILMKCGNFVGEWTVSEDINPYEAITIHFFPDVLKEIFENNIPEYLLKPVNDKKIIFQKIQKNAILKSYIDSLLVYFDNPKLFNTDTIKLKLKELIALLYQMDSNGVREILSDMFNPHQIEFKKVIEEHIFHNLTLEEFSILLNVSVSTFKRHFKEIYQSAPGQYFIKKRLERATKLLTTSKERITDICYDCGFGDLSNFTKIFSKNYGCSPSEFRERHIS